METGIEISSKPIIISKPQLQLKSKSKDKENAKSTEDKLITSTYQKLSDIEHVLKRPNIYIGSIENKTEEM